MTHNDLIGSLGVALILFSYFLNTGKLITVNGKLFYVLNVIGSGLACYASYLIVYYPFVILEAAWLLVSLYGLMRAMKIKLT